MLRFLTYKQRSIYYVCVCLIGSLFLRIFAVKFNVHLQQNNIVRIRKILILYCIIVIITKEKIFKFHTALHQRPSQLIGIYTWHVSPTHSKRHPKRKTYIVVLCIINYHFIQVFMWCHISMEITWLRYACDHKCDVTWLLKVLNDRKNIQFNTFDCEL